MDTLCWKFAKSCIQESDSINILKLGKKIKLKKRSKCHKEQVLLNSSGTYIQYPVINHNGKE